MAGVGFEPQPVLMPGVQVLNTTLPPSGVWAILTSGLKITTVREEENRGAGLA